ncbi:uncharacterized protein LOC130807571 isoform X1 [Amaranthus tricolor]|uniref:uncharacterized protein LOC130807571 isoform X1 n=1 Tax=Amaranthus tricolor TaxID=29722 RepID=UPI002584E659|nr:uncharacterized protein LOC130807571 isoform X1 [Amaranthus tricolor]
MDDLKLVKRGEPKDLKALVNHKGKTSLKCLSNTSNITEECDISKDENLHIEFLENDTNRHLVADVHEMMLEHVYNIDDLKSIDIDGYEAINLPSWASPVANYFPKLKRIELQNCNALVHISSLSQLYHLKFLKLRKMENVEYMEKDAPSSLMPFFPSLENLELEYEQVKGVVERFDMEGGGNRGWVFGVWKCSL